VAVHIQIKTSKHSGWGCRSVVDDFQHAQAHGFDPQNHKKKKKNQKLKLYVLENISLQN
jgi:hypothetical protein